MKQHVIQILLDDAGVELPPLIQEQRSRIQSMFPSHEHSIYRNDQLEDFIRRYFDNDVLESYKALVPYAYKADLGRYCLIYQLGGWHIDVTIKPIKFFVLPPEIDFFTFTIWVLI